MDISLALKWIKQHISNFGGDNTRITLGGVGSGACAASMIALQALSSNETDCEWLSGSMIFCSMTITLAQWTIISTHYCCRVGRQKRAFGRTGDQFRPRRVFLPR